MFTPTPLPPSTFLFIPGAWSSPSIFTSLTTALSSLPSSPSYPTFTIPLPSVGASPPVLSFHADVAAIRIALIHLILGEQKDVVLVMHSYGAVPACEAVRGFTVEERTREGKRGGVVGLVFLGGWVLERGEGPGGEGELPGWMEVGEGVSVFLRLF